MNSGTQAPTEQISRHEAQILSELAGEEEIVSFEEMQALEEPLKVRLAAIQSVIARGLAYPLSPALTPEGHLALDQFRRTEGMRHAV